MATRLTAALRAAPVTVPALAALALFVVWATADAGYPLTHWAPGGLVLLALLAVAALAGRPRWGALPLAVRIALGCLAAFTALSFLSILWAGVPGDAWEGANRTLLYLLVFALFAAWPQRGASAALLLCAWTLALVALAAFVMLHVDAAAASRVRLRSLLPEGRLVYPAGYANADAAQWLIAFWPALLLARSRALPAALRGALAGGAVLLAAVALLSQSRGALYATPVMLVLVFALLPGRVRTFAVLVPVAAAIGAAAPFVLRAGERVEAGRAASAQIHEATLAIFLAALLAGLLVAAGAALERRRGPLPECSARRVHRGAGALALACLLVLLAGGWAAAGDPLARARHAWDTFKSPSGYAANAHGGSRLTSGFGSYRYDFYRVALDEFVAHPLLGIGADNFAEPYLAHGRGPETPHYPHSVELRTLAQTGVLGALLALIGLGAALIAAWLALTRAPEPLARAVAAAALAGFGYWVVHGSFDWFWEFAGLGAPAFALLGLACALAPRRARVAEIGVTGVAATGLTGVAATGLTTAESRSDPRARRPRPRLLGGLAAGLLALAAALSFAAPWLSQLELQSAARVWVRAPAAAYARLSDAARLNPLSGQAYDLAGSIALRRGELARAEGQFALALQRTPGDAYATLERGAIASTQGRPAAARALLERAARLDPRDPLVRAALARARRGLRVDVYALNRSILGNARQLS
jgi:tetratricopeptide (TPR) repeat protein